MRPELRFETKTMRAADLGRESCLPDLLGERILQNDLVFRLDEDDEIYEGYGRRQNAYPYRQYNCYTRKLKERDVQTAVLENDYLTAVFLPQYGGRLWELWDKESGRNLLYTNDVLRFSNLAVRNAWFSGGVEWNIGMLRAVAFVAYYDADDICHCEVLNSAEVRLAADGTAGVDAVDAGGGENVVAYDGSNIVVPGGCDAVSLFDASGRCVMYNPAGGTMTPVGHLPRGIYVVKVVTDGCVKTVKIKL